MMYDFKIVLEGVSDPVVWRKVRVPSSISFHELHRIIQEVMGWEGYHLYQFLDKSGSTAVFIKEISEEDSFFSGFFSVTSNETLDSSEVTLEEYFKEHPKCKLFYEYDFGDSWLHRITLEAQTPDANGQAEFIAGEGACPPEDVGGFIGYEAMKKALLAGGKDALTQQYCDWLGIESPEDFDPYEMHTPNL